MNEPCTVKVYRLCYFVSFIKVLISYIKNFGLKIRFWEWRIHKHWNGYGWGKRVTIEGHFIQSYHCSSNRLEVTEKYRVNSYSFVILANHVCRMMPREFGSLNEHPHDTFDLNW